MLRSLLSASPITAFVVYAVLNIVCLGLGMGVPIFCILFGFLVGWVVVRRAFEREETIREALRAALKSALMTSLFTFGMVAVIWGRTIPWVFDTSHDLAQSGIPMILYEPRASFAGWLLLMLVVSPLLQFMTTITSAALTLHWSHYGQGDSDSAKNEADLLKMLMI